MQRFLPLSIWAARHARLAAFVVAVFELVNIFIGITIGSQWWHHTPVWVLMLSLLGGVFLHKCLHQYAHWRLAELSGMARYVFHRQVLLALFCLNLLTSGLAGGMLSSMIANPSPTSVLHGSMNNTPTNQNEAASFREKAREKALQRMKEDQPTNHTGRRVGYMLLLGVGILLAYLGAFLACNLACSGYGFFAVLTVLLSLGVLAGGFYFFGLGVSKDLKPFGEMNKEERKRQRRRYFRTLAGTTLGVVLLILLSTLN